MNNEPHCGIVCPDCKERIFSWSRHDFGALKLRAETAEKALAEAVEALDTEGTPDDCESPKCGHNHTCGPCKRNGSVWKILTRLSPPRLIRPRRINETLRTKP